MQYPFPLIRTIADVKDAIDENCFFVAQKDGYQVINYHFTSPETFPAIEAEHMYIPEGEHSHAYVHATIKREFRGIIFDMEGNLIRRPYHKFFNIGERGETTMENIDVSKPHIILEKLDGSMIAPFIVNGKIIWGTRMGGTEVSDQVEQWLAVADKNRNYTNFVLCMISLGQTPIFEWTSNVQRIVLDYPKSNLVLTAIRDMYTGNYSSYQRLVEMGEIWKLPVVECARVFDTPNNLNQEFIDFTRNTQANIEGFVIRFDNGHMYKIKTDLYCQLHRVKSDINHERGVVQLLLEGKMDDIKSMLPVSDLERINEYEFKFHAMLLDKSKTIAEQLHKVHKDEMTRKDFALNIMPKQERWISNIVFKTWDTAEQFTTIEVTELLKTFILAQCSRNVKFESLRKETSLLNNVPEWRPVMFSDEIEI